MKLYLAGPMSGLPNFNYEGFRSWEVLLTKAGYEIVSPVRDGDEEINEAEPYEFFLRRGFKDLLECDGVAMLRGSFASKGAMREAMLAQWIKIPVLTAIEWKLYAHMKDDPDFLQRLQQH